MKQSGLENKRRRRQSGNTLIEAAYVMVPYFAIFFALFDFGVAIFLKNTMQFAVRQGVRFAVTSQTTGGMGHDASIKAVVNTYSMGFLNYVAPSGAGRPCSGQGCISIDYYLPDDLGTIVAGAGSNKGGNVVQITAHNLTWAWMVPLLRTSTPLNFSVSSADVMEASPNGIPPTR
jgi:Flp pilus assembly protein TadG